MADEKESSDELVKELVKKAFKKRDDGMVAAVAATKKIEQPLMDLHLTDMYSDAKLVDSAGKALEGTAKVKKLEEFATQLKKVEDGAKVHAPVFEDATKRVTLTNLVTAVTDFLGFTDKKVVDAEKAAKAFDTGITATKDDTALQNAFKDNVHYKMSVEMEEEAKKKLATQKDKLGSLGKLHDEDYIKKATGALATGKGWQIAAAAAIGAAAIGAVATRPTDEQTGKKKWTFGRVLTTALCVYAAARIGVGAYHGQTWAQMAKNPITFTKGISRV